MSVGCGCVGAAAGVAAAAAAPAEVDQVPGLGAGARLASWGEQCSTAAAGDTE